MNIQQSGYLSIDQLTEQYLGKARKQDTQQRAGGLSFQEILEQKNLQESGGLLRFSKHALGRLSDRNIELSQTQLERLESGAVNAGPN